MSATTITRIVTVFIGAVTCPRALAQPLDHAHDTEPAEHQHAPAPAGQAPPMSQAPPTEQEHQMPTQHEHEMPMQHAPEKAPEHGAMLTPLGIPEHRNVSGTAWQPDSTPMFMWHWMAGPWSIGLHTNVFAGFDNMNNKRGDNLPLSINWVMGMARRPIGDGDLTLRAMLSLEPATVGTDGYPLLLQTGEAVNGMPLHDRQHPHDFFMELAARYRQPLNDRLAFELYAAPSGEPAIGPPAYPHRFTSLANPFAPLGHHWQDSTHIAFGVLTAGVFTHMFKVEGSWFNGREPDEDRWDIDLREPNSYSARFTVNPTADVSAQVSWAWLNSPEQLEPGVDVRRTTASLMWNRRLAPGSDVAVTAVYGRNDPTMGPSTNAGLVESALLLRRSHNLFMRAEGLQKTGHDLALPIDLEDETFTVGSFTAGYVYDASRLHYIVPGIGFVATVNAIGSDLEPFYGTRAPWGVMIYVRLRPPEMAEHGAMAGHAMHAM